MGSLSPVKEILMQIRPKFLKFPLSDPLSFSAQRVIHADQGSITATMAQAQPDVAAKRQVSESALLHLHAQIVEYNMLGHGAKFFDAPSSSAALSGDSNPGDDDIDDSDKDAGTTGEKEEQGRHEKKSKSTSKSQKGADGGLQQAAKWRRLEALGQDIGRRLAERHAHYRDRMEQDLEKVKFICKDFWESTFRKQVDVLRTNHRGLYVLTDNNFPWLASVCPPKTSSSTGTNRSAAEVQKGQKQKQKQAMEQDVPNDVSRLSVEDFIVLPCGIICGALTRLGLRCRVTADLFPMDEAGYRVSFNVQLVSSN